MVAGRKIDVAKHNIILKKLEQVWLALEKIPGKKP